MKAAIVGGGIGGLTAALWCHERGIQAEVFESIEEIRELGVGINLMPSAVKLLDELGLQDALAATAVATGELVFCNKLGQRICSEPRGLAAGYPWPQFSIHRGRLQGILYAAVRERLGAEAVRTGHHLASFAQRDQGVTASFVERRTGASLGTHSADVLIGADGFHSSVRRHFYPGEGSAAWRGTMMWRGTTRREPFLSGRSMVIAGHHDQRVVVYPIGREAERRGEALVNWVAEVRLGTGEPPGREDWSREGRLEDFLPYFEDWRFDWLDVPALYGSAERIFQYPMVDKDPVDRWSFDRVTLLGDAAHPMYPSGSQGGTQAIIDGQALARHLGAERDVVRALRDYEAERLAPMGELVLTNRQLGGEKILQVVEERAPNGFDDIDEVISREEIEEITRRYKKLAGFERDGLSR